ncbi:MAG: prephenate dehydratase [Thermomicrobiales bacterium]
MTTAFLGPRGSFSEEAALMRASADDLLPVASFPAAVAAVEAGEATQAVIPIENSIEGSVNVTLDLLIHETALRIVGELALPVRHFLVARPGATLADITVVSSHPQALGQCRHFLQDALPHASQVAALSTSGSVQEAAADPTGTRAGIGTLRAAELYGGEVLAHDIQDQRSNVTRFVVLAPEDAPPTGADKTSITFRLNANIPGSLHLALSEFAKAGIQLTKIESRPTKSYLWDYMFLVDMEGHREDPEVAAALERAAQHCQVFKVFGSYPRFPVDALRAELEAANA